MYDNLSVCKFCGKSIKWLFVNGRKKPVNSYINFFNVDSSKHRKYVTSDGQVFENCLPAPADIAHFEGYTLHAETCTKWPYRRQATNGSLKNPNNSIKKDLTPEEKQKDYAATFARGYSFMAAMFSRASLEEIRKKASLWYSASEIYTRIIPDRYNTTRAHAEGVIAAMCDLGIIETEVKENAS